MLFHSSKLLKKYPWVKAVIPLSIKSFSAEIYRYYTIKAEKAGCTETILQACLQEIVSGADYLRSKCTSKTFGFVGRIALRSLLRLNPCLFCSLAILFSASLRFFREHYTIETEQKMAHLVKNTGFKKLKRNFCFFKCFLEN